MRTVKGLVVFVGFLVAMALCVIGYAGARYNAIPSMSVVQSLTCLGLGIGLLYALYRLTNSGPS